MMVGRLVPGRRGDDPGGMAGNPFDGAVRVGEVLQHFGEHGEFTPPWYVAGVEHVAAFGGDASLQPGGFVAGLEVVAPRGDVLDDAEGAAVAAAEVVDGGGRETSNEPGGSRETSAVVGLFEVGCAFAVAVEVEGGYLRGVAVEQFPLGHDAAF